MNRSMFSHKLNYGLLFLLATLIVYASIGFAIEAPLIVDGQLSVQEQAQITDIDPPAPPPRTALVVNQ